jgi:hypothetical protein
VKLRYAALVLGLSALVHAGTIDVVVNSTDEPWNPSLNPGFSFSNPGATGPAVVSGLIAGTSVEIQFLGGEDTTSFGNDPFVDANGYTCCEVDSSNSGMFPGYPGDAIIATPVFLQEVLGDFTNSLGDIVGSPFIVGDGPVSVVVPTGATQLQLGVNDDYFADNADGGVDQGGPLTFSLTSNGISTVPETGTMWLAGGAILLVGLLRRSWRIV